MGSEADRSVVVIDPDEGARRALRFTFEGEGFDVIDLTSVDRVVAILAERPVDLFTLEPRQSDFRGFSAIRRLRALTKAPLMIVGERVDAVDMVLALELGADDYVGKPFNTLELVARCHALIRRSDNGGGRSWQDGPNRAAFGDWVVDLVQRELHRLDGSSRDLTGSEFDLLSIFLRSPNRVLSRDFIMAQLRGRPWSPFDRGIDMLVRRLRQKIEDHPSKPRLIRTARAAGYLFASHVEYFDDDAYRRHTPLQHRYVAQNGGYGQGQPSIPRCV